MVNLTYTLEEIQDKWRAVQNIDCRPKGIKRMKAGTVIDEDKSVKWNREEVARINAAYDAEVARLNTLKNKARDEVLAYIYVYISESAKFNCSLKQAAAIWNYAYEHGHSGGFHEIMNYLYEGLELANALFA